MLALELFLILVAVGLIVVTVMKVAGSRKRPRKGDAVKSPEEIASHRPRN